MTGVPLAQQHRLKLARDRFAQGEPLPPALLDDALARSWARSRDAGLLPGQPPHYGPAARPHSVRDHPDDRRLHQCVHEEVERLWNAFGGPQWTIFCANPQGVIVHARHAAHGDDAVLRPIVRGRRVAERDIGTTAPGCALNDGREALVVGNQHYLQAFSQIFCLSVPLWGTQGEVIGALDITGRGPRDVGLLQEHFRQAVLGAEHHIFDTLHRFHLLGVQHDPRWLGTPLSGVLAVEDDGRIRAASRLARRMLGLPARGAVTDWTLQHVFEQAPPTRQRRLMQPARPAQRMPLSDGSHVWIQHLRPPVHPAAVRARTAQCPAGAPVATAEDGSLRDRILQLVVQTWLTQNHNSAATARALGISRTTLYARLRQARARGLLPAQDQTPRPCVVPRQP